MKDKHPTGDRLKKLRIISGNPSRGDVAASVYLAEETYANMERGSQGLSIDSAVKLAEYYDVPLDYLILGKEYKSDESQIKHLLSSIYAKNIDIDQKLDKLLFLMQSNN